MTSTAGFAFVGCASEGLINSSLRALMVTLVPQYTFALPQTVTLGGESIGLRGALIMLAPQVSLQARADDLVAVTLTFGGDITFVAGKATLGSQPTSASVILSATVLAGFVATVGPIGTAQRITVGLDVSKAQVTAIDANVTLGPPLQSTYLEALQSQEVLAGLTSAVRSVPSDLLQVTAANMTLPITLEPTYPPPNGSTFSPAPLFELVFSIGRIVVRPLNAATPGPGALAIGVDMTAPETSNGDAQALLDLNTAPVPVGTSLDYQNEGYTAFAPGGGAAPQNSSIAVAVDGGWISQVINGRLSPQLVGKFLPGALTQNHVSFSNHADCLQLSFGTVDASLDNSLGIPNGQPMPGATLTIKLTRWQSVTTDSGGYLHGDLGVPLNADITVAADIVALFQGFASVPQPPPPPSSNSQAMLSFTTQPEGGFVYFEGAPIRTGLGAWASNGFTYPAGQYAIGADPATFQSWSTSGMIEVQDPTSNPASLIVHGSGLLTLHEATYDPYLGPSFSSLVVVGTDVSLPWWVPLVEGLANIAAFASLFIVMQYLELAYYWYEAVDYLGYVEALIDPGNLEAQAAAGFQSAIGNAILANPSDRITRLPGTTNPNWLTTVDNVVLSPDGFIANVSMMLAPFGQVSGDPGSSPYLMVTDQDVGDPSAIPDVTNESTEMPVRVGGVFTWPGIVGQFGGGTIPSSAYFEASDFSPIGVVLKIPAGLLSPLDPTVLVEWTATRSDTNEVLVSQTLSLSQGDKAIAISIDHAAASLQAVNAFVVTCRMYRPLANGGTEEIFQSGNANIGIGDLMDRHHPYFVLQRDSAFVYPGQPFWNAVALEGGTYVRGLRWVKKRNSQRIHRTDYWRGGHRCLVATAPYASGPRHYPRNKNRGLPAQHTPDGYEWNYLDALPVSLADVARDRDLARGLLCDYCFFGGPTKAQLRNDFPTPTGDPPP